MRIPLSSLYSIRFRESRNDTLVAFTSDSALPLLVPPRKSAVSDADNYTQLHKDNSFLTDTPPHLSRACAPRLSNCV